MGIRVFGHVIFDGTDLADFGVTLSGVGTFNAPERDVEYVAVPGRNGDVILDNGRYKNIAVTYPVNIEADLAVKATALNAFLMSHKGYFRLEDSYHPDEFRLAEFAGPVEIDSKGRHNRYGETTLTFNCMPQRFLKSGETEIELNYTDDPVIIGGTDWDTYGDLDSYAKAQVDELGLNNLEYPKFTLPRTTEYVVMRKPDKNAWIYPNDNVFGGEYRISTQGTSGYTYHAAMDSSPFLSVWDDTEEIYTPTYFPTRIVNPTGYHAAPLIKIYFDPDMAPGNWDLDTAFGIDGDNYVRYMAFNDDGNNVWSDTVVMIDCDSFEAYSGTKTGIGRVDHNSGADFGPQLLIPPGESVFRVSNFRASFTGILKMTLVPRWWTL